MIARMQTAHTSPWLRPRFERPDTVYRGVRVQVGAEVDMGGLKKLHADALTAYWKWWDAWKAAMANHTGYASALSLGKVAYDDFEAVRVKAAKLIDQLNAENKAGGYPDPAKPWVQPVVDPSWFDPNNESSPVYYQKIALGMLDFIPKKRAELMADMAAHFVIKDATSDEDAAAKADKLGFHPGTRPSSPNAGKTAQDPTQPAADAPAVEEPSVLPWVAGAILATGLLLKFVFKAV